MNPYYTCSSCHCYVKRSDSACPFCGAAGHGPHAGANGATVDAPARTPGRMSRARWLAYASTVSVVGCAGGGATAPAHPGDEEAPLDAAMQTVEAGGADRAADETTSDDGRASPPLDANNAEVTLVDASIPETAAPFLLHGDGGFLCERAGSSGAGGVLVDNLICDRATEWCFQNWTAGPVGSRCQSLATACAPPPYSQADAACIGVFYWDAGAVSDGQVPACTGGFPRCACLKLTSGCLTGGCSDDDAGGVTVGCGHCYGAPPARLELNRRPARSLNEPDV
jgi:hypothetical protein